MSHLFDEYFPDGLSLSTQKLLLRPLKQQDIKQFLPLTAAAELWQYFTKLLNHEDQLTDWVNQGLEERAGKTRFPFTITEKETGVICGSTSFGNISFFDKRIEIGWTWLGKAFHGTGINHHAKYAMLQFAFEELLFERVEIKTDNLNERAKQALRKIGAREEGVLRSHMLMPGGRRRDSVYFSILKNEWPEVKSNFFKDIR
jgi:RimJ/RimL family protein N-acetyltransferase